MTRTDDNTVFTGNGLRAVLTFEGGLGLVRLTIDGRNRFVGEEARLDVLQRLRAADGWPAGPLQCLFSTSLHLRFAPHGAARTGRCWLPIRLQPELLRSCYFRVRPVRNGGDWPA